MSSCLQTDNHFDCKELDAPVPAVQLVKRMALVFHLPTEMEDPEARLK